MSKDAGHDASERVEGGPAEAGTNVDASADASDDAPAPSGDAGDAEDAQTPLADAASAEGFAAEVARVVCESGCPEVAITCEATDAGQSCRGILRTWEAGECEASYAAQLPALLALCESPAYRDALSACAEAQGAHECFTQAEADQAAMDVEMGIAGTLQASYGAECQALEEMTADCAGG